jgi:DNA-directed RNA polymerase specialized sigma24 family protein
LLRALVKVEPEHLAVLKAFYWGQLSVEEISAQLGIPPGTVKSRLARGRATLRTTLMKMPVRPTLREDALQELSAFLDSRRRTG